MSEAESRSKSKSASFVSNVRKYFNEYCTSTSIHGFKYFGEKRTHFERIWWSVTFAFTLAACSLAIREVYQKWLRSPIIVSFATRETPIYSIPFPAVTICPEAKTRQSVYNHTDMIEKQIAGKKLTREEQRLVDYMGLICDFNPNLNYSENETFPDDFFDQIVTVSPYKYESMFRCDFMGDKIECGDFFVPILTDEGLCLTFNLLDRSEIYDDKVKHYSIFHQIEEYSDRSWSMEDGYSEEADLDTYPNRALFAGAKNSLSISVLTTATELDHNCKESIGGFKVSLHVPVRIPRPSQQYFRMPANQVVLAAVQPSMITTSDSVRKYDPSIRDCYFPSERKLKYFKIYTAANCQLECLTDYTLLLCDCVNYYMPRTNSTKVCGMGSRECMVEAERYVQVRDLVNKFNGTSSKVRQGAKTKTNDRLHDCDCLPICNDIFYDVETSQTQWDRQDWPNYGDNYTDVDGVHVSKLMVYFKSSQFTAYQRSELYGPTDFLANFGGLIGLFTGFSALSLMEAIYFLTVRLFCNGMLYGHWSGRP